MKRYFLKILAGILTIFLAIKFIPGVYLKVEEEKFWQVIFLIGIILGSLNFFLKPILKILTLPINLLTLGLFSFIINLILIELIDILFLELKIEGLRALFLTGLLLGLGEFIVNLLK
jgi:putative membrane protein